MDLPNLPVEDVVDEVRRHRKDTSFQVCMVTFRTDSRYLLVAVVTYVMSMAYALFAYVKSG